MHAFLLAALTFLAAPNDAPLATLSAHEILAFKNGYGFVRASGETKLREGWFRAPEAPQASFGLLWLATGRADSWVDRALAEVATVPSETEAATLDDLLRANEGAKVTIVYGDGYEGDPRELTGKLGKCLFSGVQPVGGYEAFPVPTASGMPRTIPAGLEQVVVIEPDGDTTILPRSSVRTVTFEDRPKHTLPGEKTDLQLFGRVAGADGPLSGSAHLEMTYMRKGVSWLPSYAITLGEGGKARVRLDATIINDAVDLEGGTVGFVVGVPSFLLQDMLSPASVRMAWEGLSPYFGQSAGGGYSAMMTQQMANVATSRMGEARSWDGDAPNPLDSAATSTEGEKEDLYVYSVSDVDLPRGSRGLFRLFEEEVPYEDVYLLTLEDDPVTARQEIAERISDPDLVRALERPRVWHAVRLSNTTKGPWTTGAAATLRGNVAIGQSLMPFTSAGDTVEVKLTVAPDVVAKRTESEVSRELNALRTENGRVFHRVTVNGSVTLENRRSEPARVALRRRLDGRSLETSEGGAASTVASSVWAVNPISEAVWDLTVPARGSLEATFRYEVLVSY